MELGVNWTHKKWPHTITNIITDELHTPATNKPQLLLIYDKLHTTAKSNTSKLCIPIFGQIF